MGCAVEVHGNRKTKETKGVLKLNVRKSQAAKGSEAQNTLVDQSLCAVHKRTTT